MKIKDISQSITKGTTPKKYSDNGINFIKVESIENNKITKIDAFIDEDTHNNELNRSILKKDDLLFSIAGSLGRTTIIIDDVLPANTNQALAIIRFNGTSDLNLNFIESRLNTYDIAKYIFQNLAVGAQPNLNLQQVGNISINVPSFSEQNKIQDFFDKVNKKIELLELKHQKYQDFKKYLMQQIFAQKLRFNFDDEWKRYNLGDISTIGKGFTPSTSNPEYWDGDINWLSIADMNQGKYITETSKKITEEGCKNKKIVEKDTLIMSFKLTIGRLGILKKNMFTNEAICNFKWKNNNILTEYMYYYLSSINILKYGSQAAKGITLNNDTLNTIPVLLPSIDEQEKIVNILSKIDIKIQFMQDSIEDVKNFKRGLLQQMFVYFRMFILIFVRKSVALNTS